MTFQPVVPISGFAGWNFLQRTRETQLEAFESSTIIQRNVANFKEKIAGIASAEDLVADRQLLEVALGAFGLDEDINSKYLIQKVLDDGIIDPDALANKFTDKRYFALSEAFGFGDFPVPHTVKSDFADTITSLYVERQFEVAVGNADGNMRLAMSLDRELDDILADNTTDDGRWFKIMGQPPVRQVFETALGLPSSFATLDLDLQLTGFREAMTRRFGDSEVSQFSDPEKREELVRTFLIQSEINAGVTNFSGASAALTLLQSSPRLF